MTTLRVGAALFGALLIADYARPDVSGSFKLEIRDPPGRTASVVVRLPSQRLPADRTVVRAFCRICGRGAAHFWLIRKRFYFTAVGGELPVLCSVMLIVQALLGHGPFSLSPLNRPR